MTVAGSIQEPLSGSSEEMLRRESNLKLYHDRLRLMEVELNEREKRLDGEAW